MEVVWDIDDFKIKVSKVEQPLCLSVVEVLGLMEIHQVFMVYEDLDGEERSVEVMSPRFQGTDDGKELSVVDVVVSFS